jgi:hypothetical protein
MATTLQGFTRSDWVPRFMAFPWIWTAQAVLIVQGAYYTLTGLWPIVDIESFQSVTGPKTDLWMLRTLGLLLAIVGSVLLFSTRHGKPPLEIVVLALAMATALLLVDFIVVFSRTVPLRYLFDAVMQAGLIFWWTRAAKAPKVPAGLPPTPEPPTIMTP